MALTKAEAQAAAKLTISMTRDFRGRIHATAQLLGMTTDDFVCDVLRREIERRAFFNEEALATA